MHKTGVKRILITLSLTLIISLFYGCKINRVDNTTDTKATTETTIETTAETTIRNYIHWDVVCIDGDGSINPYSEQNYGTERQFLLEGVYERLENDFECLIRHIDSGADLETLTSAIQSGVKYCDVIKLSASEWVPLAVSGSIAPLDSARALEVGLDVNDSDLFYQPYAHLTDMNVNGEFHTWGVDLSGEFDRPEIGFTYAFNKNILASKGYSQESIYGLVFNHEWTYEKMLEMANATTEDINNDSVSDIWGIADNCSGAEAWSNGSVPLIYEEADAKWKSNFGDSKFLPAFEFMAYPNSNTITPPLFEEHSKAERREQFYSGNAAFTGLAGRFYGEEGTAAMNGTAGLLPVPLGPDAADYSFVYSKYSAYFVFETQWAESGIFALNEVAKAINDKNAYFNYLRNDCLGGCENSYRVLTELLMKNAVLDTARYSDGLYTTTQKGLYRTIYFRSMTPEQAIGEYNALIQAELDSLFGQS